MKNNLSLPENLKYSAEHEWVSVAGNIATIGISDYAQDSLGDIVYVELPAIGKAFTVMQEFGVAESVKSVSSLYAPVAGKVVEINRELADHPEHVNLDPYGKGWMIKLEMANTADLAALLTAVDYKKILK